MNSNNFNEDNNLINSNEIKNNDLISSQEFMFNFLNTKFLWKELMKINTKYIERSSDISLITPYVQNILCSRLTTDILDMLSEDYIIQLVTLLQLTGQYLVYTQKMLEAENDQLKENISYLKNNLTDNDKYQRIIEDLNRQNQEKDFLIQNYQDMIQTGNGINDIDKDINSKSNKDFNSTKKTYYYCSICSGKKFKSQEYLDEHMERRHYNQKEFFKQRGEREEKKDQDINYRQLFESKLNKMKNELESMIKQKEENNEFALLNKRLELLQNQILQQNYINTGFNYKNNINYQTNTNVKQNYAKKESNIDYKKKYEELKRECKDLSKKNEEKEQMLMELQKNMANIETNKTNNKKANTNLDFFTNNYNKPGTTENETKIERNVNKYNTNEIININMKEEYESNNISNGMNKNKEKEHIEKDIDNQHFNKKDDKKMKGIKNGEITYNNSDRIEKEDKRIFNNEGRITPKDEDSFAKDDIKKENENEQLFNNNKKINNLNNKKILPESNQFESKNILISQNIQDEDDEKLKTKFQKDINDDRDDKMIRPKINKINLTSLTLSKFYREFEERNENYKGENDYNVIKVPEKYNKNIENEINNRKEEIKGKLNNSKYSDNVKTLLKDTENRNQIYKQYYERLNEALNFKEVLNSYNKYKNEKYPNQMLARNSSSKEMVNPNNNNGGNRVSSARPSLNNRFSGQSFALKSSAGPDFVPQKIPNPFKKE